MVAIGSGQTSLDSTPLEANFFTVRHGTHQQTGEESLWPYLAVDRLGFRLFPRYNPVLRIISTFCGATAWGRSLTDH